jgi:hypothetical protein
MVIATMASVVIVMVTVMVIIAAISMDSDN